MSIDTVTEKSQLRTSFGLGSTDTVEFGALETSHFNFPNLTTSELNAVTDAIEGDTYFDSDRGQLVRFTGAASYDMVTARSRSFVDTLSPITGVTLATSGFLESGLIGVSPNPLAPRSSVVIFDGASAIDSSGASSVEVYLYHDGSFEGADEGWYHNGTYAPSDSVVLPANSQIRFSNNGRSVMYFNMAIVSDVTERTIMSETLLAGVPYNIRIRLSASDMAGGNLRFNSLFTGLYSSARALFTADDSLTGNRLGTLNGTLPVSTLFAMSENGPFGFDSPTLGFYDFTFNITPSSDGVFSFTVRQSTSNTAPLYIDKASISISVESS